MPKVHAVILAAGKGSRMHSNLPKVLHKIAGQSFIQRIVGTLSSLSIENIYIIHNQEKSKIEQILQGQNCLFVLQSEQLGTAHAVNQVTPHLNDDDYILILYGDTPLITTETLKKLIATKQKKEIGLLTVKEVNNPTGYGRVIRHQGRVIKIAEQRDATAEEQKIDEINTGILLAPVQPLKTWLAAVTNNNTQNEYYLTDIIAMAYQNGYRINTVQPQYEFEAVGVNTCEQLAELERTFQKYQAKKLLLSGVTLADPDRFDLRGELEYGCDVVIDTNVIIEGHVKLGSRVHVGSGSIIKDCVIGDDVVIKPYTIIEGTQLSNYVTVGPFSHLRPDCYLADKVHIGNFVELKNTKLGYGSKAGHLSYLGDSNIGQQVNIGAGTITCNYDGINKFKTTIADNVFVGSDSQLIAPINIAKGSTIAAGTTVTDDVGENELVMSRVRQKHIQNWKKPTKER